MFFVIKKRFITFFVIKKMLETTQKSINTKWINELEHIHTMEYHTSHGNEQAATTCNNTDAPTNNTEQEKPRHKRLHASDSIY